MTRYQFVAVYILASKRNGTLYTGVTSDLISRIQLHREGQIPDFTQKYGCKTLVWYEQHHLMVEAIKREKQIKRWRREWKLKLIESDNPTWRDLFLELPGPRSRRAQCLLFLGPGSRSARPG